MSDSPILAGPACAHDHTTICFERGGAYLHQVSFMVMRCTDCAVELDRRALSRGSSAPVERKRA